MAAAPDRPVTSADPLTRVTAVVVNYNSGPWLERCLRALRGGDSAVPVVVVDNASADGSLEGLGPFPDVHLIRSARNEGFAAGVNRGAAGVATEYLLVLNPDCLLTPDELRRLVAEMDRHPECGLASGRVFDTAGSEQRGSRRLLPTPERVLGEVLPGRRGNGVDLVDQPPPAQAAEVEAVSGACMLIRSRAFRAMDGFDTGYPMHFEDVDLMARLRAAGWTIRLHPEVIATHAGGISSARRPAAVAWAKHRGLWRYLRRHCHNAIAPWQWPLWAAAIHAHGLARTSLAWLRRR